jgi:WS/DGAT/MGAT family acyltransferase
VLFDLDADPPEQPEPEPWVPRPEPTPAALLADALGERAATPFALARAAAGAVTNPQAALAAGAAAVGGLAAMTQAGLGGAPRSPLNVKIGPHRRFAWVDGELATFKAIKDALGGTVNDVVLTVVSGALRSHFVAHGYDTDIELKAMVPVSVRADSERGALGNKVAAMWAPLPIGLADPIARFRAVHDAMRGLKESGQAVGAEALTTLADFAPPTILSQATRLQSVQRFFNLTVTNVPGPQFPLYLLGRRLSRLYPLVPIVENATLGIAIMSYNGRIDFGLVSDYDALPDVDAVATALEGAIGELATLAGVSSKPRGRRTRAKQTA